MFPHCQPMTDLSSMISERQVMPCEENVQHSSIKARNYLNRGRYTEDSSNKNIFHIGLGSIEPKP